MEEKGQSRDTLGLSSGLIQATTTQVVGDDDVGDGVKHKLDVVGVGGTGDVGIHFLLEGLVPALVLRLNVAHCLYEGVRACVLREADTKGRFLNFLLEYVLLVEK